jgi:hypothetical protein
MGGAFGSGLRVTCLATDDLVLAWNVDRDTRGRVRARQALRIGPRNRRSVRRSVRPIPLSAQRYPFDKEVHEMLVVTIASDQGTESRVLLLGEDADLDSWVTALS